MKIAFLISDVIINGVTYRAKKKNVMTYDADGNILTIDYKTFAKSKYDTLEVASVEEFSLLANGTYQNTEAWEIEPDALPN